MSGGGGVAPMGQKLQTITLAAPQATLHFANIVQAGFTDLQIRMKLRTDVAAVTDIAFLVLNGDAVDANYDLEYQRTNNAALTANPIGGAAFSRLCGIPAGATATVTHFGFITVDLFDYVGAATKTYGFQSRCFGTRAVANYFQDVGMGEWANVAAINDIVIAPWGGPNFVAGSVATLYGIN